MKLQLIFLALLTSLSTLVVAQSNMTPERLIQLGRVHGMGIDGDQVIFGVSQYEIKNQVKKHTNYSIGIDGKGLQELTDDEVGLKDKNISPDGKYTIVNEKEKLKKISGIINTINQH